MSNNSKLTALREIRNMNPEPKEIQILEDTEEDERQETELESPIVVQLSNGKLAVGKQLSANDYLLYIEKSMPPRQPGSSARAIGQDNATLWLIQQSYTVDGQMLTDSLMDDLGLSLKDFSSLVTGFLSVEGEIETYDNESSITSQDFDYKGHRIKRKNISWRYGTKLQKMLSQGRVQDAYTDMITTFWTIDDGKITPEMMTQTYKDGGIGSDLCKLMVEAIAQLMT